MMVEPIPFIPGPFPGHPGLLTRYLPPIPTGVVAIWLRKYLPISLRDADSPWVLDPFGTAPQIVLEAARAGYTILVAANNPVTRFLFELAANPPAEEDLRAALAEISAARKGEERLEIHLRNLYNTDCRKCGREVKADKFLWERESSVPYACTYTCPACRDSGEYPISQADIDRITKLATGGLHRARALERIAPPHDPDRSHAEEALSAYLPRAVYALSTLINRLEGLPVQPTRRRLRSALVLSALDRANTLWPHPAGRARPRQLTIPTRFRENNVWLALEEAVQLLAEPARQGVQPVALTSWPDSPPPGGGVVVYEGRLKDLVSSLERVRIGAVVTALPRPNQAFWTLSALWAGWLWGREAAAPYKGVLRRRRYDWGWHSMALHAGFSNLSSVLPGKTPFLGLIGEAEPGFMSATLIAAAAADFNLIGIALAGDRQARGEASQAQINWRSRREEHPTSAPTIPASPGKSIFDLSLQAARGHIQARGEPAAYLQIHTAALIRLIESRALISYPERPLADIYAQTHETFERVFSLSNGFLRYGGSEKSLDVGLWWLQSPENTSLPLADRVEIETVRYLQKHPGCASNEIYAHLCVAFPGQFTADPDLVQACLESYGEREDPSTGTWRMRLEDAPASRRADLKEMHDLLFAIGDRLGFQVELQADDATSLHWNEGGQVKYVFKVFASAVIEEAISALAKPLAQAVIVLPGGRANLVVYKMRANPRLRELIVAGWRFLKFRQLRNLGELTNITREMLARELAADPLADEDPQLRLL